MLKRGGQLDMKIGSGGRVGDIHKLGELGLDFIDRPQPPSLPREQGLIYFQVNRDVQPAEWRHVRGELTLAVQFNERSVRKATPGQNALTIDYAGQNAQLRFTLYVLRNTNPSG
jgi:hypothetical protein